MSEEAGINQAKNQQQAGTTPGLLPYSGRPLANPDNNEHVPNTESRNCNHDRSGKVLYRYKKMPAIVLEMEGKSAILEFSRQ